MAILYDARGNEIKSAFADTVTNETVTDARPITAVLAAANAEVIMDLNGANTATYDIRTAAAVLTFLFEGTIDNVNYFALPAFAINMNRAGNLFSETFFGPLTVATTLSGSFSVNVAGFRRVRIRVSAYTSGNITVAARANASNLIPYARPIPSEFCITNTGVAGAGVTLTVPTGGPGLFHYITNIHITRNATAALAGTATLVITSTNLPSNPAWSVGNAMIAGGSQLDLNYTPTTPLKSAVADTATTIVMPAPGAAVLWRANVSLYIGA